MTSKRSLRECACPSAPSLHVSGVVEAKLGDWASSEKTSSWRQESWNPDILVLSGIFRATDASFCLFEIQRPETVRSLRSFGQHRARVFQVGFSRSLGRLSPVNLVKRDMAEFYLAWHGQEVSRGMQRE